MKNKKRLIFLVGCLTFGTLLVSCAKETPHTHVYVPHAEVPSTCYQKGTEFYYSCEGCKDLFNAEKNKIAAPIEIALDPNNHEGVKKLAITSFTNQYKIGDTFDMNNCTLVWKCEHCSGVSITSTEKAMINVTYPTAGASSFTVEDTKSSSVKVTLNLNSYSVEATVHVGKKDNAITGLVDLSAHCGYEITNFDDMLLDETISATSGESVKLSFSDTIDGTYKDRSEFSDDYTFNVREGETVSKYYVKASTMPTEEYVKAEAGPVTITITHNELKWDTSRDDYDFVGCLCDVTKITKFKKVPTNQTTIILTEQSATLDLTGTDYNVAPYGNMTIESVFTTTSTGEVVDLGKSLTISTSPLEQAGIYGATQIAVVASHNAIGDIPACAHTIMVPVIVASGTISTAAEWTATVTPKAAGDVITGYFVVTKDLTIPGELGWISDWDKALFSGTIDGDNHTITLGQSTYGQFYVLNKATIKNVTFANNWWRRTTTNYYLMANKSLDTTFDHVKFAVIGYDASQKDTEYTPVTNYGYLFGNGGAQRNAFNNCVFDFEEFQLPCLLSHSLNNTESITFEDSVLKCKGLTELYYTNLSTSITEADGLTIEISKQIILDIAPVKKYADQEGAIALVLPSEYQSMTIDKIMMKIKGNEFDLGKDLNNVVIPSEALEDVMEHGDKLVYVIGKMDSVTIKLGVPVRIVTQSITTVAEFSALTHLNGTKKTIYGYYELANDLNFNIAEYVEFSSGTVMYNTFAGTLDGNGKTITSKSRIWGLIPEINSGTIRNLTITDAWSYGGIDGSCSMLSLDIMNSKVEDVTFKMTAMANRSINTAMAINAQNYGWINTRICQNTSFKNCTFDGGTTLKIQTLVGTHPSCVGITFADCVMKCDSYFCLYQSSYSGIVTTTQTGITISGTCVYTD